MPDFLSGFDKVAAQNSTKHNSQDDGDHPKPCNVNLTLEQSQYSPPFTSRSFDDLHQHLGRGLSPRPFDLNYPEFPPLPLDINDPKPTTTNASSTIKSISNSSVPEQSMSADSYAMFAQQSALAVSQHSAYFRSAVEGTTAPASFCGQVLTPSVVNVANLRAHSMASSEIRNSFVSGSKNSSSEWGGYMEESESAALVSGSGSDNASDTPSNDADSDSNSYEGPNRKKAKVDRMTPSLCFSLGL